MNLFAIFLTGLTTGGLSCLAVQGGFLAGIIANQKKNEKVEKELIDTKKEIQINNYNNKFITIVERNGRKFIELNVSKSDFLPVTMFLCAKLLSHAMLGLFLGLLGSRLTLSLTTKLWFQGIAAVFMFASAMNLLNVHPIFRYLSFQPPRFLARLIRNESKSASLFAPFVLGLFTIFIPCGVTQAMEVLVISLGNPFQGMLIMIAFVLGTVPLFSIIGVATSKLSETWSKKFSLIAGVLLIGMSLYTINGIFVVLGFPLAIKQISSSTTCGITTNGSPGDCPEIVDGVQNIIINITSSGYDPKYLKVKKGIPVKLTIASHGVYSCALAFVMKEFKIETMLDPTDSEVYTFTPNKSGKYIFSCSMGMYSGILEVVE
jgi:uncharacterized protein